MSQLFDGPTKNLKKIIILTFLILLNPTPAISKTSSSSSEPSVSDCEDAVKNYDSGDYSGALISADNCLMLPLNRPYKVFMLRTRADIHSYLGSPLLAIEDQLISLRLEEAKDVWPWVLLGAYYREAKRFNESISALSIAHNYDEDGEGTGPGMAVFYHTGLTYYEAGEYQQAIEAFSEGVPKQPDYGWVFYHRALAYEALGDKTQAKEDLSKARELIPLEGYNTDLERKFTEYGLN